MCRCHLTAPIWVSPREPWSPCWCHPKGRQGAWAPRGDCADTAPCFAAAFCHVWYGEATAHPSDQHLPGRAPCPGRGTRSPAIPFRGTRRSALGIPHSPASPRARGTGTAPSGSTEPAAALRISPTATSRDIAEQPCLQGLALLPREPGAGSRSVKSFPATLDLRGQGLPVALQFWRKKSNLGDSQQSLCKPGGLSPLFLALKQRFLFNYKRLRDQPAERGRKSSPQRYASAQSPEPCQEPATKSCSSRRARREPAEPGHGLAARGLQPSKRLLEDTKGAACPPRGSSRRAAARSPSRGGAVGLAVLSDEVLATSRREKLPADGGQPGGDGGGNVRACRGPGRVPPAGPGSSSSLPSNFKSTACLVFILECFFLFVFLKIYFLNNVP